MRMFYFNLVAAIIVSLFPPHASALEYPATCRGASAVVTEITGLDSARSRLSARYTYPDAYAYCHYSLGNGEKRQTEASVASCAADFMRNIRAGDNLKAEANCQTGSLSTSSAKWSNAYKFPLVPMCGDDNNQAIALFRILCPNYRDPIERD